MQRKLLASMAGRIKNYPLPYSKALMPLFEAVVNSLQAINDRKEIDGNFFPKITIEVIRTAQMTMDCAQPPIDGFVIKDNGIGFNDSNMESFTTSDSTYKAEKGGKGIGRFTWLKVFKSASIESIYQDGNKKMSRKFEFSPTNDDFDDNTCEVDSTIDVTTSVKLQGVIGEYSTHISNDIQELCKEIIHHCITWFFDSECPKIVVIDSDDAEFDLKEMFSNTIEKNTITKAFFIDEQNFTIKHVKLQNENLNKNILHLCAHNRSVKTRDLSKLIPDLDKTIFDKLGYFYLGILTGEYLDDTVSPDRLSFAMPTEQADFFVNSIAENRVVEKTIEQIKDFLKDYLKEQLDKKMTRFDEYTSKRPEYKHLMYHMGEELAQLPASLNDEELDDRMHAIKRKFEKEVQKQSSSFQNELRKEKISFDEYEEKLNELVMNLADVNKSSLAEYVAHRKVVIELLREGLKKQEKEGDKYNKEQFIHELIYPMQKTSGDVPSDNHNLWLIDEKLAYCNYIISDKSFKENKSRPDILLADKPVAMSDSENCGKVFDTIIIYELKRPMRDDYNVDDNPYKQLKDYARKIRDNKVVDIGGRPVRANDNTRFYLYALCDITQSLQKIIDDNPLKPTPDGDGFYEYFDKLNAHIEIIPFHKLVNDAEQRNKMFFDKLGIIAK